MKTILLSLSIILLLSIHTRGQNWYYNNSFKTNFRAKGIAAIFESENSFIIVDTELIEQGKENKYTISVLDENFIKIDSFELFYKNKILTPKGIKYNSETSLLSWGGAIWDSELDKSSPFCAWFNLDSLRLNKVMDSAALFYEVIRDHSRLSNDSGFIGTGYSLENGYSQVFLRKSDNDCQLIWYQLYGSPGWQDAHSVAELQDGGFIMGAWVNQVNGYKNILLIRTDSLGNEKWSRQYGGPYDDGPGRVLLLQNGNVLVTSNRHRLGDIIYDNHIMEIRPSNGSVVWEKQYGHGEFYSYFYSDAIELENRDIVVGGLRNLFSSEFNGIVTHSTITRLDSKGKIIWDRVLFLNPHHLNIISQQGLKQARDGGYWLFGYMHTETQDGWLIKVDSLGCPYPDCDSIQVSSDPAYVADEPYFRVGPVPAINELKVYYKFPYEISAPVLEVIDLQGRKLYRIPLNGYAPEGDVWMDVSGWTPGMYFMQIVSDHKALATRKVMVGR